jgi:HK97 family phage major capsid protein
MEEKEINSLVGELRKTNEALEAGAKNTGELKEKLAKIETRLDASETENQKLVAKLAAQEKSAAEEKAQYENLEKLAKRMPNGSEAAAGAKAQLKAFEHYIRHGKEALSAEEVKFLRTDSDPEGGFLAPLEYIDEILKKITLISPIRQYARVRPITAPGAMSLRRDTLVASYWTAEGKNFTPAESQYGQDEIPLHSLTGLVRISTKQLFGSRFNMENEINKDLVEEFARAESQAFVVGDGVRQPSGFVNCPAVEVISSGVADDITFDATIDLFGALKTGYNGIYGMNRHTVARMRKLKDGVGQYIWQAGNPAASIPNAINGYPYIEIPHMDDIGAGNKPVCFADFAKGYLIVDGITMQVLRNPYKEEGFVRFTAERFVGGQVVLAEAIKVMQCAE